MRGGTLFSGIGSPELAAPWIDWRWCAEIDPFASAVHAARFPHIPNLGDVTKVNWDAVEPVDIIVFGSPCQSFSVAGQRQGLDDPRGNMALVGLQIVDRVRPDWVVFENVPGILSSLCHEAPDPCPPPDPVDLERDGQEMDTEDEYDSEELHAFNVFLARLSECGYGFSYRILDAQFAGVPQRRRRVFVVGHLGGWTNSAAVLLERESLRRDPPPRREAGEGVTGTLSTRPTAGGELGTDFEVDRGLIPFNNQGHGGTHGRLDFETETFVTHSLRAEGFDGSEDGTGRGTPIIPILEVGARTNGDGYRDGIGAPGDPMYTLSGKQHAEAFDARQSDVCLYGERAGPLDTDGYTQAIAFTERTRSDGRNFEAQDDIADALCNPGSGGRTHSRQLLDNRMMVRRLLPEECEALQGFPRSWTTISYNGKPAADGPRYRSLGNAMAVPVVQWILDRIKQFEEAITA